jgi:hypothetical protein
MLKRDSSSRTSASRPSVRQDEMRLTAFEPHAALEATK